MTRSPSSGATPVPTGSPTSSSAHASGAPGAVGSTGRVAAVKLLSSSTAGSVYQLSDSAPITLTTSGRCWVEIRSGNSSGPVIHEATLVAGSTEDLSGPVWLRLGNPTAVEITVGSTTVTPPVTAGGPYDLEFRSAS